MAGNSLVDKKNLKDSDKKWKLLLKKKKKNPAPSSDSSAPKPRFLIENDYT